MTCTRLCFRILGAGALLFNCQSRNEIFCFAVFLGKDTRYNMEINLLSFDVVGEKGWLYKETKYLVDVLKVHLTVSGDTPWLNRLLTCFANDSGMLSRIGIWFPDPPEEILDPIFARHHCKKSTYTSKAVRFLPI